MDGTVSLPRRSLRRLNPISGTGGYDPVEFSTTWTGLRLSGHYLEHGFGYDNLWLESPDDERLSLLGDKLRARCPSVTSFSDQKHLSWRNVNVDVTLNDGTIRKIIRNVSGRAPAGSLLAIMGSSGAGKSTLMNVLTGRTQGRLNATGQVLLNGVEIGDEISSLSAYVQQHDVFIGTLKVREHLMFQALLRLPGSTSRRERDDRVNSVLIEMGLNKCKDTLIGIPGVIKGISGGEAKRLSFASEIIPNPPLLFCDEPTTGLDSFMAENVVQIMKELANRGKTVLCTIHQPSSQVFNLFDRILLMAEGRVAYMGPREDAVEFFASENYICPENFNPSDFFIRTLAIVPGQEGTSKAQTEAICDAFDQSKFIDDLLDVSPDYNMRMNLQHGAGTRYTAGWARQVWVLIWRAWLVQIREPAIVRVRVAQTIFLSLFIGLVYLQKGANLTKQSVNDINGVIWVAITASSWENAMTVVNVFPREMPVFKREHRNRIYRVDSYFLAKSIAEVPVFTIISLLLITPLYWMAGLWPTPDRFFLDFAAILMVSMISISIGYTLSALSSNLGFTLAFAPCVIMPLMLVGGIYANVGSIPPWISWIKYFSWFMYSNEIMAVNQWTAVKKIDCNVSSTDVCLPTGDAVMKQLSFSPSNIVPNFMAMLGLFVALRLLTLVFLMWRTRKD